MRGAVRRGGSRLVTSVETSASADTAWVRGFHGAMRVDTNPGTSASLRELALSRRSTGFGPFRTLIELPAHRQIDVEPLRANGSFHVGRNGEGATAVAAMPPPVPGESVTDYIDRRLGDAQFLLLPNRGRPYAMTKRLLDIVGSVTLLTLFAPVLVALAVLIRLDSPGPAVFRQTRVTRGGRTFTFYKFRTMFVDARERFPALYDYGFAEHDFDNAFYKLADDPRNTRVGRWLRRTTLDELPNLLNVLRGDLSLVGPRPDLPELVRFYRPDELACLFTKAGLTGFAQVAGRSLLTVRERLTLDLRYVAQQNILLDLRILWRTVVVVISGRGAF